MPSTEGQKSARLVMNTQRGKGNPRPRDSATGAPMRSKTAVVGGRRPVQGTDNQFPKKKS